MVYRVEQCSIPANKAVDNVGTEHRSVRCRVSSEPDLLLIPEAEEPKKPVETIEAVKRRYARKRSQYPQYAEQSQVAKISFLH